MTTASINTETGEILPAAAVGMPDNLSSPNFAAISAALAKARPNFAEVKKSKTVTVRTDKGSYSYSYATLDDVIDAVSPALAAECVNITQPARVVERGVMVRTFLTLGDQWLSDYGLFQPANTGNAQSIGSGITYARRYGLTALLNIPVEEDDDGAKAQSHDQPPAREAKPAKPELKATKQQRDALNTRVANLTDAHQTQIREKLEDVGIAWETLTVPQFQTIIGWVAACEKAAQSAQAAADHDAHEAQTELDEQAAAAAAAED